MAALCPINRSRDPSPATGYAKGMIFTDDRTYR
jgi:hypothetical protein